MGPGTQVGPFRVERLIATGTTGAVYEATQVSLRRKVALRLIDAAQFKTPDQLARFDRRQRLAASVHHPNLVPVYEVGEWDGGRFVATRLLRGSTLAELRRRRRSPDAEALAPLADALRAAHAVGVGHGAISDHNILIEPDGTPYLADLGVAPCEDLDADVRALSGVISRPPARPSPPVWVWVGLGALGLVAATAAVVSLAGGKDAAAMTSLGCREEPTANTPACTLAQTSLDGGAVAVERGGVIRSWSVAGGSGDVALQVLRERDGRAFAVGFSQPQRLDGAGRQEFAADIPVQPGDLIGLRLGPGAAVGAHDGPHDAVVARWDGGLTSTPQLVDHTTRGVELGLETTVDLGARPDGPRQLVGERAEAAPAGRALAEIFVALPGARAARVQAVALEEAVALDLLDGKRIARLEVPDADPAGELLELVQACGPEGVAGFCLRWINPGQELPLQHAYRVTGDGRLRLIG